ncbi:NHLP bacteriocin export ABC transporter permease/ATPase subunit [Maridesulfovibrio sp.]|uniref:NHLP bacteriocin export ABC transporter permease/ATPase subunit n=1 Tax=Maridesulfovibrio sp. TaxID=2795000 RepID=UPI0039EFB7BD
MAKLLHLQSFFTENGIRMDLNAGSPILLAGSEEAWFIAKGRADVFIVNKENPDSSMRTRCFSVESGHILFGHPADADSALLAVGTPGTEAYRVHKTTLSKIKEDEELARLIDNCIDNLHSAVTRAVENIPQGDLILENGSGLVVPEFKIGRPENKTVWIRHIKGQSLFMGVENLNNNTEWFPIVPEAWIKTISCSIIAVSLTAEIARRKDFWEIFNNYLIAIINHLSIDVSLSTVDRYVALKDKDIAEQRLTTGGLNTLSSVMDSGEQHPLSDQYSGELSIACAMVAHKTGHRQAVEDGLFSGDTLDEIVQSAGMRSRKVLLRGNWYKQDGGPLLGFTISGSPVALLPSSPSSYQLIDPEKGTETAVNSETLANLSPEAHVLYRPLPDKKLKLADIPKFGLHGSWKDIGVIICIGVVVGIMGLVTPSIGRIIFEDIIPGAERGRLMQLVAIMIGFSVASLLFQITQSFAMIRMTTRTEHNLETALWERLMCLPVQFFRKFTAGDLAQRAMAMNSVQNILTGAVLTGMSSAFFSFIYLGLLFHYDLKLAFLALGITIFSGVLVIGIGFIQIRFQRKAVNLAGRISGETLQFITGVSKIKAGGAENRALMLWAGNFAKQCRTSYKMKSVGIAFNSFNAVYKVTASALIFMGVLYFKRDNALDFGTFIAFWMAYGSLQNGVLSLVGGVLKFFQATPYFERLEPILSEVPENSGNKGRSVKLKGNIEISSIDFRYAHDGPKILNDVSIQINQGEFIAITGSSGSGKTTLLRLLLGFEKAETGAIFYENQEISQLDIHKLRNQLGVVLQNGGLMPGDIFTNITGTANLTIDDAWEAARMAGFDHDIKEMPMGMHTVISEGAGTLSGGQKQRLIIARALARKPKILIFDEATSALDNRTQEIVTQSLNRLTVTRIVIAHRLSTIKNADKIVVLENGRVEEIGTYDELLNNKGTFFNLVKRQTV